MTTTLKCLRCGRDGHLPADCKVPVLPDDRVLASEADALTIAANFKRFAQDHAPDGWPAVQQRELDAAARCLLDQHAEIARLKGQQPQAEARPIQECYGDCPTNPATCAIPCKFNGRPAPQQAEAVRVCKTCKGEKGWERATSSTRYVWVKCPDCAAQQAEAVPPDCDVRKIMVGSVPGPDGMGHEVYAKSVDDVVNLLTKMGERIEDLEGEKKAEAVPPGYVLVPVEPTLEMGWAYLDAANAQDPLRHHVFNHDGYRAMIAAAIAQQKGGG